MAASVPATLPAVGARAAAPSARPPRYLKAPPTPSEATATSPSSAAPLPSPLWPALRRAPPLVRAVQEALYVVGSTDDLWWLRLRPWAGITLRRKYSAASWGSWERKPFAAASPAAPAPTTRSAAACAPSAALRKRPVMEGGP